MSTHASRGSAASDIHLPAGLAAPWSAAQHGSDPLVRGDDRRVPQGDRLLRREGPVLRPESQAERERLVARADLTAAVDVEQPQVLEEWPGTGAQRGLDVGRGDVVG